MRRTRAGSCREGRGLCRRGVAGADVGGVRSWRAGGRAAVQSVPGSGCRARAPDAGGAEAASEAEPPEAAPWGRVRRAGVRGACGALGARRGFGFHVLPPARPPAGARPTAAPGSCARGPARASGRGPRWCARRARSWAPTGRCRRCPDAARRSPRAPRPPPPPPRPSPWRARPSPGRPSRPRPRPVRRPAPRSRPRRTPRPGCGAAPCARPTSRRCEWSLEVPAEGRGQGGGLLRPVLPGAWKWALGAPPARTPCVPAAPPASSSLRSPS